MSEAVKAIIWAFSPTFYYFFPGFWPGGHVQIERDNPEVMSNRRVLLYRSAAQLIKTLNPRSSPASARQGLWNVGPRLLRKFPSVAAFHLKVTGSTNLQYVLPECPKGIILRKTAPPPAHKHTYWREYCFYLKLCRISRMQQQRVWKSLLFEQLCHSGSHLKMWVDLGLSLAS